MITTQDLQEAIAECQGERNPNAQTCIKLAAYYTIMEHLGDQSLQVPSYSHEKAPFPPFPQTGREMYAYSGEGAESAFLKAIRGRNAEEVWPVIDELMTTLEILNPRLYKATMKKVSG